MVPIDFEAAWVALFYRLGMVPFGVEGAKLGSSYACLPCSIMEVGGKLGGMACCVSPQTTRRDLPWILVDRGWRDAGWPDGEMLLFWSRPWRRFPDGRDYLFSRWCGVVGDSLLVVVAGNGGFWAVLAPSAGVGLRRVAVRALGLFLMRVCVGLLPCGFQLGGLAASPWGVAGLIPLWGVGSLMGFSAFPAGWFLVAGAWCGIGALPGLGWIGLHFGDLCRGLGVVDPLPGVWSCPFGCSGVSGSSWVVCSPLGGPPCVL
eukprot:TRINITY_DN3782_c0_g1_i2.p1 TRINITY_DN3782_c0_g1~~TRINITY_DN3782_c0_g1_i2.p1  ORF type:complete len:260 (+),score=5.03 TRINITY_DN3782_c0_g1_i2:115-894(+)